MTRDETEGITTTTLDGAIEQHAALNPDHVAVVSGHEVLTFGELNARANRIAWRLRHRGIEPGTLVGICVERSAAMIVGLVGILRAGGAYVALDPAHPEDRLAFLLQDSGVPLIVTQQSLASSIPNRNPPVVLLDEDSDPPVEEHNRAIASHSHAAGLAYVTYTSGSTGTPKGVLVTHENVLNLVREQNYVTISSQDRVAALATLSFDASTFEIWAPLVHGATCVIYTFSGADLLRLLGQMRQDSISVLHLTSPVFRLLGPEHYRALSGVRSLLFGGDAVRSELGVVAATRFGGDLIHLYGPSETTGFATYHDVRTSHPGPTNIPIGVPIAHVSVHILSPDRSPVADGNVGELYIGGAGVARGYLKRPDLTAERFVSISNDGVRLYRTGDLVRRNDDGALEFMGRIDRQIKVRGYRIEPGEIEHAFTRHPWVDDALVVARDDGKGDKRLDAYVVPASDRTDALHVLGAESPGYGGAPSANGFVAELRRHLAEALPKYQIPATITVIPSIPLTHNLKVDEARLPPPMGPRPGELGVLASPRDSLEITLAQIWRDTLGVAEVGIDDDFFDLGGDSISAMQVVSQIGEVTGRHVDVGDFFAQATIRGLSRTIEGSDNR